jgi:hypothetical protein
MAITRLKRQRINKREFRVERARGDRAMELKKIMKNNKINYNKKKKRWLE